MTGRAVPPAAASRPASRSWCSPTNCRLSPQRPNLCHRRLRRRRRRHLPYLRRPPPEPPPPSLPPPPPPSSERGRGRRECSERGKGQILTRTRPTAAVPTGDGPLPAVRTRRASVSPRGNCWRAQPVRIGVSAGKASDYASW